MKFSVSPHSRIASLAAFALVGFAAIASAQPGAATAWNRGTTLELTAGAANASPNTNPAAAAAIGWELNHFTEIEGVGAWLLKQNGSEGFAADMKLLVNLMRPARVVPYLGAGGGVYWQAFDSGAAMPPFYAQRVTDPSGPARMTFRDPTIVIGGGANFYVATHMSVRPDFTLRLVMDGSETYKVTTLSFSVIYHFEEHPRE
jgi:hypothetical protein